ncbi:MAG: hypothetical protein B7X93_13090 [Hydrogenophilales bacterium 17-61-9]|nr:MAG: hypothetical protein B7X93_13090 [Hydrogenophilales bacterium 17-61-9]
MTDCNRQEQRRWRHVGRKPVHRQIALILKMEGIWFLALECLGCSQFIPNLAPLIPRFRGRLSLNVRHLICHSILIGENYLMKMSQLNIVRLTRAPAHCMWQTSLVSNAML